MAAPALFAAVTPAMTRGLRVRVTVKRGNATATSPSPLAEIPVAHQRRQNAFPKPRRTGGAPAAGGASTEPSGGGSGALSGAPAISRITRLTEANAHLPRLPGRLRRNGNRRASGRTDGYQGRVCPQGGYPQVCQPLSLNRVWLAFCCRFVFFSVSTET